MHQLQVTVSVGSPLLKHHFLIYNHLRKMFPLQFVIIGVCIVLSGAVTDNARDLRKILGTPSFQHFRYNFNRNSPSVPTRE